MNNNINIKSKINCWGSNEMGQIDVPQNMDNIEVKMMSNGWFNTCAVHNVKMFDKTGNTDKAS